MSELQDRMAENVKLADKVRARIDGLEARVAELEGAIREHMDFHDELWISVMHIDRLLWQHVEPDGLTPREKEQAERHARWEEVKKQRDANLLRGNR